MDEKEHKELIQKLEAAGEDVVRRNLRGGAVYGHKSAPSVQLWLESKDKEREDARAAADAAREEEALSISREALAVSKSALADSKEALVISKSARDISKDALKENRTAIIAAAIAAAAAVITIIISISGKVAP